MSTDNGLGDEHAQFKVYIGNRPNFPSIQPLNSIQGIAKGEIHAIGQACGNGWRKVFNVYAKLLFALNYSPLVDVKPYSSWQDFRDQGLLRHNSNTALLFSEPDFLDLTGSQQSGKQTITIIMGKTYANSLPNVGSLTWLDNEFALIAAKQLIVCPYFDYRQLSNIKILRLVTLIKQLISDRKPE